MKKEYTIKLIYNPDNDKLEILSDEEIFEPCYFEIDGKMIPVPQEMKPFITGDILGLT